MTTPRTALRRTLSAAAVACCTLFIGGICGPDGPDLPDRAERCSAVEYNPLDAWISADATAEDRVAFYETDAGLAQVFVNVPLRADNNGTCAWVDGSFNVSFTTTRAHVVSSSLMLAERQTSHVIAVTLDKPPADLVGAEGYLNVRVFDGDRTVSVGGYVTGSLATGGPPANAQADRCDARWDMTRTLELLRDDEDPEIPMAPYSSSVAAPLVWGFQGGSMIIPRLRIANPDGLSTACIEVALTNTDADGKSTGGMSGQFMFTDDGTGLLSGFLYDELDSHVRGTTITVGVSALGPGFRVHEAIPVFVE